MHINNYYGVVAKVIHQFQVENCVSDSNFLWIKPILDTTENDWSQRVNTAHNNAVDGYIGF